MIDSSKYTRGRSIQLIELTLLNGNQIFVNPNLIELLEATPDTLITLTTGKKLMVCEAPEDVAERFTQFAAKVNRLARSSEETVWT